MNCLASANPSSEGSPQGVPDFMVSQAVDQGISKRSDDSIKERKEFVQGPQCASIWEDIHKDDGSIVEGDHNEVGGAGGEGFLTTSGGRDSQNGHDDAHVGGECEEEGGQSKQS